jgi:hypothetical protein
VPRSDKGLHHRGVGDSSHRLGHQQPEPTHQYTRCGACSIRQSGLVHAHYMISPLHDDVWFGWGELGRAGCRSAPDDAPSQSEEADLCFDIMVRLPPERLVALADERAEPTSKSLTRIVLHAVALALKRPAHDGSLREPLGRRRRRCCATTALRRGKRNSRMVLNSRERPEGLWAKALLASSSAQSSGGAFRRPAAARGPAQKCATARRLLCVPITSPTRVASAQSPPCPCP